MKRVNIKWIIGGLILGTAVGLLSCSTPKTNEGSLYLGIVQPLEETVEFEESSFKAEDGIEHVLPSGSKVTIPEDALVDKNGNPVKGDCEMKFREFHSTEDIFLSGITMQIDEAGKEYMSSGGMMELRVEQNGEEVQLAPGKEVDIELISEVDTEKDYQLFKLENDKSWSEGRSFDRIPNKRKKEKLDKIQKDLDSLDGTFTIKTDFEMRPYIQMWKGIEWKLVKCKGELPWTEAKKVIWDYVQVNSSRSKKGIYQIEIVSTMHTYNGKMKQWQNKIYAIPQVDEATLAKLKKDQDRSDLMRKKRFAKMEEEAKERAKKEILKEQKLIEQWQENMKAREAYLLEQQKRAMAQKEMVSNFKISGFGIYNIDRLCKIGVNQYVETKFEVEDENNPIHAMFLILKEDRSVIRFYPTQNMPKLNMECSIVVQYKDASLGYVSPEQYYAKVKSSTTPGEVVTLKPERKRQDELAQLFMPSSPARPKFV